MDRRFKDLLLEYRDQSEPQGRKPLGLIVSGVFLDALAIKY